ncbi:MAG: Asp-tRNA(Asn)/Glu-tRNA(Gln) amidotransferase subunit GatA [Candidatus Paceibacterota bacterium]
MEIKKLTIKKAKEGLKSGDFSAEEITKETLNLIEKEDKEINSYLRVFKDVSLKKAKEIDSKLSNKENLSDLAGVPLAIKDNILIKDTICTSSSKILENYISVYDASVIDKLNKLDSILIGKTNMDEFAMGSSTENSAFKVTKNPHDLERVPGGSSGGSAASVAAGMSIAALGSDTGGSIRQPAAFCGVVGLKPTYGAVSRHGLMAMASSLDQIGPITKTVEDAAILFQSIKGKDFYDSTSIDYDFSFNKNKKLKDLVIGIPKEYFSNELDNEVGGAVNKSIDFFKKEGFKIKEISLPHTKYALACYYIIMPAEVSSNLARFDGVRYSRNIKAETLKDLYIKNKGKGFGEEVKRRILLGTFVLSSGYYDAYYGKAQKVRNLIKQDFYSAFKEVDVILTPTTPTAAFKIGEKTKDPISMYLSDIFTVPSNLAGVPALSLPISNHKTKNNLPVSFQLIGKHKREEDILNLGYFYEKQN